MAAAKNRNVKNNADNQVAGQPALRRKALL
jgi:hypothetical protein